jgi:uncharacterized membrane protein YidH (DUF202 family)
MFILLLSRCLQAFGSAFEQTLLDMVSLYSSSSNSSRDSSSNMLLIALVVALLAVAATLWYTHQ